MKVLMYPKMSAFEREESGIKRVVEAYHRYLPAYGIDFVESEDEADLVVSHAGVHPGATVVHTHGLYWSADYHCTPWELRANRDVVESIRHAKEVTVPSRWVQESFQRDMRFSPHIIPHGIVLSEWEHDYESGGYVLWNKNRNFDVCDPVAVGILSEAYASIPFVTTFAPYMDKALRKNIKVTGLLKHDAMKKVVQKASVYLSTTKETFGIGVLEAMASGVPVLGYAHGGNLDLVQHGVTGYLAEPNNTGDLIAGLEYCMNNCEVLGANAKEIVKQWTWEKACEKVARVYELAVKDDPPTVAIIIPTYNYGTDDKVGRAIRSAMAQTYGALTDIVVVDDGSNDDFQTMRLVQDYMDKDRRIKYIRQQNSGVANARNRGIEEVSTKYVCCLDADDAIEPNFLAVCIPPMENDLSIGVTYTGLYYIRANGDEGISPWPKDFNYDDQLKRRNQIPTCCVFRRKAWERTGGYKQRYAPDGAGSEDAEFWTRIGAYGWDAKKVTDDGLFIYSWQTGRVSGNKDYNEPDWLELHPWAHDGKHPFASVATPTNKLSHLVRQYDSPTISIIIPVGEHHADIVSSALDTIEGQDFRNYEVVMVWDSPSDYTKLLTPYPYLRIVDIYEGKPSGAGYARNRGVEHARGDLLFFLDADDQLYPDALTSMFNANSSKESIVYSDYVGKAYVAPEDLEKLADFDKLLYYREKNNEAIISYKSYDYDCELAQNQPYDKRLFIWNLVSSLTPKEWHQEIGGFDENMSSWEDWDYWLRMARAGKCFTRIPRPLVVYRFYSGTRRETGLRDNQKLLQYLRDKYRSTDKMPCCGGRKYNTRKILEPTVVKKENDMNSLMNDGDMMLVLLDDGNRGQHKIVGANTGRIYGYRASGDKFLVHKDDYAVQRNIFTPIQERRAPKTEPQAPPPEPKRIVEPEEVPVISPVSAEDIEIEIDIEVDADDMLEQPFNLQMLPGVTPEIAMGLNSIGVFTEDDVLEATIDDLTSVKGIGLAKATTILNYIKEKRQAQEEVVEEIEEE